MLTTSRSLPLPTLQMIGFAEHDPEGVAFQYDVVEQRIEFTR